MYWRKAVLGALMAMSASTAHAGFVSTDWQTEGDRGATLHEETGIEWMDLSRTDGMSIDAVRSQMAAGGQFEGWRLPTAGEVGTMMNAFFDGVFDVREGERYQVYGAWDASTGDAPEDSNRDGRFLWFGHLFGETFTQGDYVQSRALHLNDEGEMLVSGIRRNIGSNYRETSLNVVADSSVIGSTSESYDPWGVWLVSDGGDTISSIQNPALNINNPNAPVNVPVGGTLLMSGLLMGAALRRRLRQ